MLAWQHQFSDADVKVWDYWDGPVKHMDVGYLSDNYGRIINEQGLPYCVIHQFKPERNMAFVQELKNQPYQLRDTPSRRLFEDTRYKKCEHPVCQGKHVHPAMLLMIEKNITGGFWGDIPDISGKENTNVRDSGYQTVKLDSIR